MGNTRDECQDLLRNLGQPVAAENIDYILRHKKAKKLLKELNRFIKEGLQYE